MPHSAAVEEMRMTIGLVDMLQRGEYVGTERITVPEISHDKAIENYAYSILAKQQVYQTNTSREMSCVMHS